VRFGELQPGIICGVSFIPGDVEVSDQWSSWFMEAVSRYSVGLQGSVQLAGSAPTLPPS